MISARQHGFVRGHSVTTNLLSADNVIADCVNTGTPYDVITFDMAQAFDKVPHAMLINVLYIKRLCFGYKVSSPGDFNKCS